MFSEKLNKLQTFTNKAICSDWQKLHKTNTNTWHNKTLVKNEKSKENIFPFKVFVNVLHRKFIYNFCPYFNACLSSNAEKISWTAMCHSIVVNNYANFIFMTIHQLHCVT